jgi:FMN phosphatase YigB (HAD superfamily)
MIKAVLLDLDNTLLENPDDTFAGAYLELIDSFFQKYFNVHPVRSHILQCLRSLQNPVRDLKRNNLDFFISTLAELVDLTPTQLHDAFEIFYKEWFPRLRSCARSLNPVPLALINRLLREKLAVAIATNPIYPQSAIYQRLEWAGLADIIPDLALVTHAGNMHFAKPDPAYYAEVVARIGIEPDEAIMVGDSHKNDMQPAAHAGLDTYHIEGALEEALSAFQNQVIQENWRNERILPQPNAHMVLSEMRGNIGAIYGTIQHGKAHFWHQRPDPNEWSPVHIICHLVDTESTVQRARLERILREENPFLVSPPSPPGPQIASHCADDGHAAADIFQQARNETLSWLSTVPPEDWHRPARHSIFGPTTFLEMAHFTAQHDRLHINQLCQTLGRCQ